jgi:hypothetical protein
MLTSGCRIRARPPSIRSTTAPPPDRVPGSKGKRYGPLSGGRIADCGTQMRSIASAISLLPVDPPTTPQPRGLHAWCRLCSLCAAGVRLYLPLLPSDLLRTPSRAPEPPTRVPLPPPDSFAAAATGTGAPGPPRPGSSVGPGRLRRPPGPIARRTRRLLPTLLGRGADAPWKSPGAA